MSTISSQIGDLTEWCEACFLGKYVVLQCRIIKGGVMDIDKKRERRGLRPLGWFSSLCRGTIVIERPFLPGLEPSVIVGRVKQPDGSFRWGRCINRG